MEVRAAALWEAICKLPDPDTYPDDLFFIHVPKIPLLPAGLGKEFVMTHASEVQRLAFRRQAIGFGRKTHREWVLDVAGGPL